MITSTDKISDKASSGKDIQTEINMWALKYQGPGKKGYVQKKKPILLKTTDAIVKMTKTTICGTDLHIMNGDVPSVTPVEFWDMKELEL